jgi:hypothetical protein
LTIALAAGIAVATAAAAVRKRVDARIVARHLDRADPALAESAELLLVHESTLPAGQRFARRQTEAAFAADSYTVRMLPDRVALRLLSGAAVGLAIALAVLILPRTAAGELARSAWRRESKGAPVTVTSVRVEIRPPAYLGAKPRRQQDWDLEVPEGSVVTWTVGMSGAPRRAVLATTRGERVRLTRAANGEYVGTLRARESALYRLELPDRTLDFHQLAVHPDAAPAVVILRPAPRSVIARGASRVVPLEALVRDDYGVTSAGIVATVTSGEGESVRFRERALTFSARRRANEGTRFSVMVNLDTLGMAPGDELYFHVQARDTRRPPNVGRSETVFLALADTGTAGAAEFSGLSLGTGPEYFRSQRQIILDTEKLIADAPRLPIDVFRERANAIGMDQGLLRLRYGEFTGEEFETSAAPDAGHEHDDPENATLLDPGTKATLKGAIAEMWQAELRLRTYRPKEALPYEYRALDLLKTVQQASRAYVQRVGFEPPPLEPDRKRLSGKLESIRSAALRRNVPARERFPASRTALARIREMERAGSAAADDGTALDAAIAELAAASDSNVDARLAALRAVRTLVESLRTGRRCPACIAESERALVAALPLPGAMPRLPRSPSALSRRYVELLRTRP